jgi:hypothetical protein
LYSVITEAAQQCDAGTDALERGMRQRDSGEFALAEQGFIDCSATLRRAQDVIATLANDFQ